MPFASLWWLPLAISFLPAPETTGFKIVVQSGVPTNLTHRTTYIQPDRMRTEYRNSFGGRHGTEPVYGPRLARIVRCDLGQSFELNLDTSEYTSVPYPPKPFTEQEIKARGLDSLATSTPKNPTIRIEIKTSDTGERKEIFGHTARHVITTTTQTRLAGSNAEPQETVTDGWYIDFNQQLSCGPKPPAGAHGYVSGYLSAGSGRQLEKPEFVMIGERETGFPLESTMTAQNPSNLPDRTIANFETRVIQFEKGPLDPALFEIPPGFKLVDRIERNPPPSALGSQP